MTSEIDEAERNVRRSRRLARRLADNASDIAETVERAARLHDEMAADELHPLRDEAAMHAKLERDFAARERRQAEKWTRVADREPDPG